MDFRIGDVVNRTFGSISRNFTTFFLLSLVLVGVPTFITGLAQFGATAPGTNLFGGAIVFAWIVGAVAGYILQGAIIHGAVVDFNGARASLGDCLSTGLKHFLPLVGIAILMTLGIAAGMLLLIIPGIILAIMWAVAIPAQVIENMGVLKSFGRSRELTKGSRWKIFGLFVIYIILAIVIGMMVMLPASVFTSAGSGSATSTVLNVFQTLSTVLSAVVGSAGVSALYYELRKSKEGVGADALASVFD
ncbi:MAG: hypothetical protein AAGC77_09185 [Pseudomonadota bacterium]